MNRTVRINNMRFFWMIFMCRSKQGKLRCRHGVFTPLPLRGFLGSLQDMKCNSRKRSLKLGEHTICIYDDCLSYGFDYAGGTDADHIPVIPGNDFVPEVSRRTSAGNHL